MRKKNGNGFSPAEGCECNLEEMVFNSGAKYGNFGENLIIGVFGGFGQTHFAAWLKFFFACPEHSRRVQTKECKESRLNLPGRKILHVAQ